MNFDQKLKHKFRAVGLAMLHFSCWIGALFLSKVVLILEHVSLGWVNTICLSGALFGYNVLSVVRRHLGEGGRLRLFMSPLPEASRAEPNPREGQFPLRLGSSSHPMSFNESTSHI